MLDNFASPSTSKSSKFINETNSLLESGITDSICIEHLIRVLKSVNNELINEHKQSQVKRSKRLVSLDKF